MMVDYEKYIDMPFGCRMSIDNLIAEYKLLGNSERRITSELEKLFVQHVPGFNPIKPRPGCGLWEYEKPGKYQWFRYMFAGDGVSVSVFKYAPGRIAPVLKLEVNPNKHWKKPILEALRTWLADNCTAGTLRKYDVAVDVPAPIDAVTVCTRKAYNWLNGTRYFGQRNKHGHLRVYDKRAELAQKQGFELDDDMTRLEWTFETRSGCSVKFDDIGVAFGCSDTPPAELRVFVSWASLVLDKLGREQYEACLKQLNFRTRKKVRAYVDGSHISPCPSADDVRLLLSWYGNELSIAYSVLDGQWFNYTVAPGPAVAKLGGVS